MSIDAITAYALSVAPSVTPNGVHEWRVETNVPYGPCVSAVDKELDTAISKCVAEYARQGGKPLPSVE